MTWPLTSTGHMVIVNTSVVFFSWRITSVTVLIFVIFLVFPAALSLNRSLEAVVILCSNSELSTKPSAGLMQMQEFGCDCGSSIIHLQSHFWGRATGATLPFCSRHWGSAEQNNVPIRLTFARGGLVTWLCGGKWSVSEWDLSSEGGSVGTGYKQKRCVRQLTDLLFSPVLTCVESWSSQFYQWLVLKEFLCVSTLTEHHLHFPSIIFIYTHTFIIIINAVETITKPHWVLFKNTTCVQVNVSECLWCKRSGVAEHSIAPTTLTIILKVLKSFLTDKIILAFVSSWFLLVLTLVRLLGLV